MEKKKIKWAVDQLSIEEIKTALDSKESHILLEIYFDELVYFEYMDADKHLEELAKNYDFLFVTKKEFKKLLDEFKIKYDERTV